MITDIHKPILINSYSNWPPHPHSTTGLTQSGYMLPTGFEHIHTLYTRPIRRDKTMTTTIKTNALRVKQSDRGWLNVEVMSKFSIRSTCVDTNLALLPTHHIQAIITFCNIIWFETFLCRDSSNDIAVQIQNCNYIHIPVRHVQSIVNGLDEIGALELILDSF